MTTVTERPRCDAVTGKEPTDWGFRPVRCGQVVATRGYWARTEPWENTGHFVAYCPIRGHREDVERRFPPHPGVNVPGAAKALGISQTSVGLLIESGILAPIEPPMPTFLHEDPDFRDHPADATVETEWSAWTEGELVAGFGK